MDSNFLPKIHLFIRCPKIYSSDAQYDDAVAERLLQQEHMTNDLQDIHREVKRDWHSKTALQLRSMLPGDLSKKSIKLWACGPYAEKLAIPPSVCPN
jgi:hypothetical protein